MKIFLIFVWRIVGNCVTLKSETKRVEFMRFIGTVDAKVDQKGRVFVPALFRRSLRGDGAERLIMRKDIFENCLVIYPESVWNERLNELHARLSVWNRDQQRMFRQFVADVEWLVLDSNGRILLPKRYLRMAGIEQDVTFIGMDSTIEIWAKGANECDNATPELGEALQNLME